MKIKTFILTFLMMMSCSILFGQELLTGEAKTESKLKQFLYNEDYGTITIGDDFSVSSTIEIPNDRKITIDLNGHKLTTNADIYIFKNFGRLTITDNSTDGKGTISSLGIYNGKPQTRTNTDDIDYTAQLTIKGGVFENISPDGGAAIYNHLGVIDIQGGEFYGEYSAITNFGVATIANAYIECLNRDNGAAAIINDFEIEYGNKVNVVGRYTAYSETASITDGEATYLFAELNGVKYPSLQAALDACTTGDNTINLLFHNSDNATVSQEEGVNITIDGNGYKDKQFEYTGTIYVNGNSRHTGAETLTIQDINFTTENDSHDFISCNDGGNPVIRYAHNVTVQNCNFTATEGSTAVVALRFRQSYNINVVNSEFTNLHSAMWATGTSGIAFDNITATNCKEGGISAGTSTPVSVKNSIIEGAQYGVRADGSGNYSLNSLNIEGGKLTAAAPVIVRNTTAEYNLTVNNNVELDATENGPQVVVTADSDNKPYVVPTSNVNVTLYDNVTSTFGLTAKIGNAFYATLQDAVDNAETGETVTLIADNCKEDVTVTQAPDYAITIDGDGKTFKGTITVDGKSARYETTALTIKNVNFDATEGITYDACVRLGGVDAQRYTNNVTVENCTFTDNDYSSVAVKSYTGGDRNLVVKDCEANGMHSLLQLANVEEGLIVDNCTANTKNGLNLGSSAGAIIKNSEISVQGYAVRIGAKSGGDSGAITLENNTLKTNNSEGDAVIVVRGNAVTQVDLSMEKNVVSGATHISGNTAATNIDADANYWGEGLTGPVVAEGSAPVVVNSYYSDEAREQLIVTALTLQQFVEKVTEGNGTYNGTFTEGGVEKNITVKVVPVSGDARTTDDVRVPNRLQKYTNPEVYYAQYQRFSGLTDVNISNVNFVFYPAAVTVTDAWNTAGATTTADNINGELQLLNTGSVSFANCSFEKMSVSPINAATLSVTSSTFNGLDAYAIKDVKATTATITGTTFTDCNGGFWFNNAPTTLTVTDNTFTGTGRRGAIQFSANGDYANTEMTVTGNEVTDEAAFLWQLNNTISNAQLNAILDKNNNTYTTAFVEGSVKLHLQGEGTADNPYLINDISDLEFFRDDVNAGNDYAGKYIQLNADIDLADENWVGIGTATADHGFMGNFDGKTYKIKNLTITNPALDSDGYAYAGLFGVTEGTETAQNTIKNLTIENVTISTTGHIVSAAIAYPYYTIVDNVKVCGNINITGGDYTAGALAYTRRCVDASNITVEGGENSIIKGKKTVGGVISDIQMNGGLTANYSNFSASNVTVEGEMSVGGISGIIAGQTLNTCSVKNVTLVCSDNRVGIVSGSLGAPSTISSATVEDVTGATNIIGATYDGGKAVEAKIGDTYYATLQAALNAVVEGTSNGTVELISDIDLTDVNWTPVGTETKPFIGSFNGNEHTIKNLNIVETEAAEGKAYVGLFGYAKNATIKNVTFENVNLNIACLDIDHSQGHIGAVAGSLEGTSTIENVTVKGDIIVESTFDANGASRVAVVAGGNSYGNVTMKNVHVIANEGSYLKANNNVGALAGQLQGKSVFENCSSNIDVTGMKFFAGGIIGLAAGDQTFTNCHTTGDVTITAGREGRANDQYRVGGIAGGWADGKTNVCTLTECSYTGQISGTNADGSVAAPLDYAGYVGRGYTLANCAGSKVVIDGVEYVQAYDDVYGVYEINGVLTINTADALEAVAENPSGSVSIVLGSDITLTKTIKINAGQTRTATDNVVTLDLNGRTITGTDNATGSFGLIEIQPGAELIINDSSDDKSGKITLTATNNREWNAYSSVISNQRGKLTVNGGTIEHLGGTDMAYAIDNLTNGQGTYAETVINGGTMKSPYRAIRQFLNGIEAQNFLTVNGGTIEGTNKSIWMQDPNKNANTGTLTVGEEANLIGDVYLYVTPNSTSWPVEVSIADGALQGESTVMTANVPAGYELKLEDGVYGVKHGVAKIGDVLYESLAEAATAATTGQTIELLWQEGQASISMASTFVGNKTVTITGTANVDWSKGFFFVGRNGEGDGKVIFDNANLTSDSNSSAYGFNVSGSKVDDNTTNNGIVEIKNSTIVLDYMLNKNVITLDNSTLTVKNGFSVTGRKASESATGEDATATMTLSNNSKVVVNNMNGMGIGHEAYGIMNIDATSTFETTQDFNISANGTMNNAGTVNITGTLTNEGTINFTNDAATLKAQEGLTINYDLNPDKKVVYVDGVYKVVEKVYVAQIGENKYESLQEAVEAAQNDETITLLVNVEQTDGIRIDSKNIVVDLNEKTFTVTEGASTNNRNFKITGTSVVTIKNGTMIAAGDYSSGAYGTVRTEGTAEVTLTGLKLYNYRGNGLNIKALAGTTVAIDNTEIYSQYGGGIEAAGGTITLAETVKVEQKGMYTAPYNSMAISVNGDGLVTVNGGTYSTECIKAEEANNQGTSHGPWVVGVLNSGGTLIINGGTFSNDNFGDNSLATYARGAVLADTKANVQINGGTFNALAKIIDIQNNLGDAANNPVVTLKGGTYSAVPTNGNISNCIVLAQGYIVVDNENGTFSVVEDQVAKIGDVTYKLLQEAFNAAQDGDEIVVLKDIVLTEGITVAADKTVALDLNGKTITGTPAEAKAFAVITNKGNLTITDGTETEGKIVCDHKLAGSTGYAVNTITNSGTLTIVAGTIQNTSTASNQIGYAIDNNSTTGNTILVIEGDSKVTASGSGYYDGIRQFCNSETNENSVTIKGGEVSSLWLQNPSDDSGTQNTKDVKGSFAINGGTLNNLYLEPSTQFAGAITGGHVGNISRFQTAEGRDLEGFITGGIFSVAPSDYCAEGYSAKDNGDGTYSVIMTSGTQEIALAYGWNWFSSYIDLSGETGLEKVQTALGTYGVQIKGKFNNNSSSYQDLGNGTSAWIGDFDLSTKQMYMINTSADVTMEITGNVVDREETTISLGAGWNWISYPLYETLDINEALANHNTAADGDAIKTLDKTSVYYSTLDKWIGDLTELTPGQGYMYKSANATSFVYSAGSSRSAKSDAVSENKFWKSNANKFANNMTVVAMLSIDGELVNDNYEIAAFANGECRGSARPVYVEELDQYILFLTINGEDVQELTFKYYDVNYGTVYELNNRINYSNDAVLGSIDEPYMFNLGILNIEEATLSDINIYPNPTTTGKEINLEATCDKVEVFNALGVKVAEYSNVDSIDAIETAGIYVIRVTIDGDARNCRLVVK